VTTTAATPAKLSAGPPAPFFIVPRATQGFSRLRRPSCQTSLPMLPRGWPRAIGAAIEGGDGVDHTAPAVVNLFLHGCPEACRAGWWGPRGYSVSRACTRATRPASGFPATQPVSGCALGANALPPPEANPSARLRGRGLVALWRSSIANRGHWRVDAGRSVGPIDPVREWRTGDRSLATNPRRKSVGLKPARGHEARALRQVERAKMMASWQPSCLRC
jgi:hypothetical protein